MFGNINKRAKSAKILVCNLELQTGDLFIDGVVEELNKAKVQYELELQREEIILWDQSWQCWLKAGDSNTEFFRACILRRRNSSNFILKNGDGD